MARVVDAEGRVIDESIWGGTRPSHALVERLDLLAAGRMTGEARQLAERFPEAETVPTTAVDWPELSAEEAGLLQEATLHRATRDVAAAAADPDRRLEHLVRGMEEARGAHLTFESRLVEWLGMFLPGIDADGDRAAITSALADSTDLNAVATSLGVAEAAAEPGPREWAALHDWAARTLDLSKTLEAAEAAVRELAGAHLPSLSALLGPLLAAKLCVTAHGRMRLARLPAGTVQVLGAEKAFFMHLRQGIDPPKHGHIFQHPWICRSPRWTRGPIARMLAAKAVIAARVDAFGGEAWTAKEVAEVERRVGEIRARRSRR